MVREPQFLCDAMLGGLAKWLRAAGYRAEFDVHVGNGELVRRALEGKRWLLTSDSGILVRYAVSQGVVRCTFVPRGLSTVEQLAHVMAAAGLSLGPSLCMVCGGELTPMPLQRVWAEVPEKVRTTCRRFFRCCGCGRLYWHGSHWDSISDRLHRAADLAGSMRASDSPPGR